MERAAQGCGAVRLRLDLRALGLLEGDERLDRQALLFVAPGRGDAAVDGDRGVAGDRELVVLELGREDAVAVLVGEQGLVPVRQEARREPGRLERAVREVVERRALLVLVG